MHPAVALFCYLIFVLMGAAALAPLLHAATAAFFPSLLHHPYHRFVNRTLWFCAVAGLVPFYRALKLRGWNSVGIKKTISSSSDLAKGFACGVMMLGIIALAACLSHARVLNLDHTGKEIGRHFFNATLAGIFAGLLEELLFRGVFFGGLRQRLEFWRAAILSSGVYALLHFFDKPPTPEHVTWASGFVTLGGMLGGFVDVEKLVPAFLNLFLLGCIFAAAYERRKTLYFGIALHAALIFCVKSFAFFTSEAAGASTRAWGGNRLVDGWAATVALTTFLLLLSLFLKPSHRNEAGMAH